MRRSNYLQTKSCRDFSKVAALAFRQMALANNKPSLNYV